LRRGFAERLGLKRLEAAKTREAEGFLIDAADG
jgi:hypothetical protein